ncbi:lnt [Wigglesworthia glossinidia endosymbiont of Glossina brevipalpis]|uniref:Apolipoprotein N-acyltransferase n=1 Tax=Wigglesworthia glossinidia brevipalpis TaxID=36870 RepID=LNT_WIGBR|nr:RecName: Full=Apolipoprotein N-acyltransferase; Short=ALP N-acyltransferase [Wigglesworthia glossinidia endosymbiont of Glossina brevipalpis]BAC24592.1 lnt [Wigglesworthia glossinidia endosymbiont of Glossina brevipalpis]
MIKIFTALFFGSLNVISFSPYNFWPASIISIFGLLIITTNCKNLINSAKLGFLWGIGNFFNEIYWIYISINKFFGINLFFSIIIILLLSSYLSLYPTIFVILTKFFFPKINFFLFCVGAPSAWMISEILRSKILTGFPWLEIGYSQINGPLKGLAPIIGVSGISYILIIISGMCVLSFYKKSYYPIIFIIFIITLTYPLNFFKWYSVKEKSTKIALIQGNISQHTYIDNNQIQKNLEQYLKITKKIINSSNIIIWPESAIPCDEISCRNFLLKIDKELKLKKSYLITGIISLKKSNYYNSIITLGGNSPYLDNSKNKYYKYNLVPFGEKLPLKSILNPIFNKLGLSLIDLKKGDFFQNQLKIFDFNIVPSICYEIIFGDRIRKNVKINTDFLLTISNDSWFGDSIGPWQHFNMARMRALETGKNLLRASNNGITAIIGPNGELKSKLPQFVNDFLLEEVFSTMGVTPYVKFGNIPLLFFSIICFIISFFIKIKLIFLKN